MEVEFVTAAVNIVPMEDRVLVVPFDKETQVGKIILADIAQRPANRGIVVAVGPGRCVGINSDGQLVYTPMEVKRGDIVAFGWSAQPGIKPGSVVYTLAGQPIKENGVDYVVLRLGEIICKILRPEEISSLP